MIIFACQYKVKPRARTILDVKITKSAHFIRTSGDFDLYSHFG